MEWGDIMRRERPSRRFCGNSEGAEIVKGQDGHPWNLARRDHSKSNARRSDLLSVLIFEAGREPTKSVSRLFSIRTS